MEKAAVWIKHTATPMGRSIASDLPIEARLRDQGFTKNYAGNIDNFRWRETGPGSVEAYRVLSRDEAEALRRRMMAAAGPQDVATSASNRPNYEALEAFFGGPCPICGGIHGCSHTRPERLAAGHAALRFQPR